MTEKDKEALQGWAGQLKKSLPKDFKVTVIVRDPRKLLNDREYLVVTDDKIETLITILELCAP